MPRRDRSLHALLKNCDRKGPTYSNLSALQRMLFDGQPLDTLEPSGIYAARDLTSNHQPTPSDVEERPSVSE